MFTYMSSGEQKDIEKLKTEQKKYEVWQINREEARSQLNLHIRKDVETINNYAFDLKRLMKLAHSTFNQANTDITKDYFVKGLHPEMPTRLLNLQRR